MDRTAAVAAGSAGEPAGSTVARAPSRTLLTLPEELHRLEAPVFGEDTVSPGDADLTSVHAGEPLGERIIVTGRVLDSLPPDVRAVTDAEIRSVQQEARALVRAQALRRPQTLVLSALGGLIIAARLGQAVPAAGLGSELDVIAAVFIGGASAMGGVGQVIGAVVGGFIMGVMNNGMSIMGVNVDWQQVVKGLVLLGAVVFDVYNKNKA